MTYPKGHVTTTTAYWGGAAYTVQQKNFNVFGKSLGETVTVPSSTEGNVLGVSYTFNRSYTAVNGCWTSAQVRTNGAGCAIRGEDGSWRCGGSVGVVG
jgi:hypothetical protein